MQVQPYLHFEGRCDEAIEFYKKAVNAEVVMLMRFKDAPCEMTPPPGTAEKVMHGRLRIGDSVVLVSDGQCQKAANFEGFSLCITTQDASEAQRLFAALAEGGKITMPMTKTFFSTDFGMLTDRFGVSWMVYVGT